MVGAEITAVNSLEEAGQELAREPAQALLANAATVHDPLRCIQESNLLPGGVPVIICAIPDTQQAAEAIGAADYLIKPISQEELFGVLDRLAPRGGTVLVVDDEPEAARLYMRMFAASGRRYHVLRATDGQQALIMLREYRPDVVLLDLVMPDMDGFRVLAVASQDPDLKDIPIVIISARDPAGQPIVTNALSVTRADGISMAQLLDCIDSLCRILSVVKPSGDPKWQVAPAD